MRTESKDIKAVVANVIAWALAGALLQATAKFVLFRPQKGEKQ